MGKIMKIFKDETNVYSGNCHVNSVIFRGRIYSEFHGIGQGGVKFSLQLSNGKDEKTGEWFKPTFADCTAFGEVAKRILKEYKPKDEIWIIAKYYSRQHDSRYYKGFIVRDIISEKEHVTAQDNSRFEYSEKRNNNAREASNSGAFYNDDLPF